MCLASQKGRQNNMPMDRSRYPANWQEISQEIRFGRANGCCEWCGVANYAIGQRDKDGKWWDETAIHHLNSDVGHHLFGEFPKMTRIILTVAHLGTPHADGTPGDKHDKMDVRPENLAALCQRCHLNYDRDEHIANRRTNARLKRQQKTGQMDMFTQ